MIPDGALSEGEKEIAKVIQYSRNCVESLKKSQYNMDDPDHTPKEITGENPEPKMPNTVPFPVIPEPDADYEFFEKEIILSAWVTAIFFIH